MGSDGNAVAPYGVLGRGKPHPRYYGTFPRYLGRYVLDQKVLPLEEAIRRITSFTAEKFGLPGRGKLSEGYFADVTVLDLNRIMDRATFENPRQYPDGVAHVLVNGRVVVRNGEHTGELPGRILKREVGRA